MHLLPLSLGLSFLGKAFQRGVDQLMNLLWFDRTVHMQQCILRHKVIILGANLLYVLFGNWCTSRCCFPFFYSVNATATKVKVETNKIEDVSSSDKPMDSLIGQRVHGLPNKSAAGPDVLKKFDSGIDVQAVLEAMEVINRQQFVRNEEVFGPVDNETIVIAVQVGEKTHHRGPHFSVSAFPFLKIALDNHTDYNIISHPKFLLPSI